jgi:hypothetical protein
VRRRRWGPLELVDTTSWTGPIRASYLDQWFYMAICQCRENLIFDARNPAVTCDRCDRKYQVQPAKVG